MWRGGKLGREGEGEKKEGRERRDSGGKGGRMGEDRGRGRGEMITGKWRGEKGP